MADCRNSNPLVVKTIRLRRDKFIEWRNSSSFEDLKARLINDC